MRRVLGIDPGLVITGYGCIDGVGPAASIVEAGVIRLVDSRRERPTISDRLAELDRDVGEMLERLRPEVVAVEALFAHYKHPATAIAMGHARGVILLGVRRAGLELVELRPAEVKRFVTGHGQAKKGQVQGAVATALGLSSVPKPADVADALGIALCALSRLDGLGARAARRRS